MRTEVAQGHLFALKNPLYLQDFPIALLCLKRTREGAFTPQASPLGVSERMDLICDNISILSFRMRTKALHAGIR